MRRFFNIKIAIFLMLIFAVFCAIATFIEAGFNTQKAKDLVYNAWYFKAIILALTIMLIALMYRYKMHKKLSLFLIHISFIFIFVGAALTHFYGFEGIIHIRADNYNDEILSTATKISVKNGENHKESYDIYDGFSFENTQIKFLDFTNEARYDFVKSDNVNDKALIKLNFTYKNDSFELDLAQNECNLVQDLNVCFNNKKGEKYINIYIKNGEFYANSNVKIDRISGRKKEELGSDFNFSDGVYFYNDFSFNPKALYLHAKGGYISSGGDVKAIKIAFIKDNLAKEILLPLNVTILHDGYELSWAQDRLKLDYKIYLKEFNLVKYPASNSPKDYESKILILDDGKKIDASISMNNVLDYKGIRFFQHNFDDDLKGSILTANKDIGKIPTYIGYFLLFLGCFLNIFSKDVRAMLKALAIVLFISIPNKAMASDLNSHLNKLDYVITQDLNDRFLPFYTLAKDLCNKLKCPKNANPSEEIFKLISDVNYVNDAKIIRVKNEKLKDILGISDDFAKFSDFYDDSRYKLKDILKLSYAKGEANFNEFDKELLRVDESVNIFYLIFTGELFKILPENPDFALKSPFADNISLSSQKLAQRYLSSLLIAKNTQNYDNANEILDEIKRLQHSFDELPSENKIKAEVFLSKIDGFYLLCKIYILVFLLSLFFINKKSKIVFYTSLALFILHLSLLALRGFIAGFAPLSNTYESLIYISLVSLLAGLIFRKNILLSMSLLLAMAILFVAHLNDINPQITNLIPVLNSPYLSIHVSLISASYGFFALASFVAFWHLIKQNDKNILYIKICIHFGLLLLVCGNFLGAIWANESWGRYWGWDSKETWSLVSILIYSALLHLPLTKLKNDFLYASLSMWAFCSILMTYFGVNYYLNGMHSYAGEKTTLNSPLWLIISVIVLIIFNIFAYYFYKKRSKND